MIATETVTSPLADLREVSLNELAARRDEVIVKGLGRILAGPSVAALPKLSEFNSSI
jgi:hypothetical protein